MDPSRATRVVVTLAAPIVLLGGLVAGCGGVGEDGSDPAGNGTGGSASETAIDSYSGYTVDPRPDVSAIALPAADGSPEVAMPAELGGIRLVYFGYTACPDVCPTTLSDVKRALSALPAGERERVDVAMVTVDPTRDAGGQFVDYVRRFVPEAAALRTEDEEALRSAAGAFGANYEVSTAADGSVEVSHTGELYAVDDQGLVVMQWPFGTNHQALERDIRSLLVASDEGVAPATEGSRSDDST